MCGQKAASSLSLPSRMIGSRPALPHNYGVRIGEGQVNISWSSSARSIAWSQPWLTKLPSIERIAVVHSASLRTRSLCSAA